MRLKQQLSHTCDMKSDIMGDDQQDIRQQQTLNRVVTWSAKSIEYEADPRHAGIIVGYDREGKVSVVPGCKRTIYRDKSPELPTTQATQYRAAAARCNFLAIDRPDIQYPAKEGPTYTSSPHESYPDT